MATRINDTMAFQNGPPPHKIVARALVDPHDNNRGSIRTVAWLPEPDQETVQSQHEMLQVVTMFI